MPALLAPDHALDAYDSLAPFYDEYTAGYAHEKWVAELEARALSLGLNGRRAFDLACGTGKSTEPLLRRGYAVRACDISSRMVREAQRKLPDHADAFEVADMRSLPPIGPFDLVVCLDDAINYLLSPDELTATFAGVAAGLASGGIFVFDVNTLATYRGAFAQTTVRETQGCFFIWRGEADSDMGSGGLAAATVEAFVALEDGLWHRRSSRHVQRHHPRDVVTEALESAGLCCRAIYGQLPGAILEPTTEEFRHTKLVYFAGRADGSEARSLRSW